MQNTGFSMSSVFCIYTKLWTVPYILLYPQLTLIGRLGSLLPCILHYLLYHSK